MDDLLLDYDPYDKQLKEMLEGVEVYISDIHADSPPRWISLLGTSGAGKTMLAERIIKWAKAHQYFRQDPRFDPLVHVKKRDCGLLRWSRCCDWMLNGDYGWVPQAKSDWIVCLDDIGVEYEKIRALATSKLYEILEARRGLWTILTANLSVQEIAEKMDTRIASRLFRDNSSVFDVDVQDYNIRKHLAKKKSSQ